MKLTATRVRSISEPGKYIDQHGLILRVAPGGSKQWVWRGTIHGKRRDIGLGAVAYTPLAEAHSYADGSGHVFPAPTGRGRALSDSGLSKLLREKRHPRHRPRDAGELPKLGSRAGHPPRGRRSSTRACRREDRAGLPAVGSA